MQKLSEAPDRKRGDPCTKKRNCLSKNKETHSLSAVTSEVKTLKSFLLLAEGLLCPFLCSTLVNLSTNSSHLCYQQPTTKNTK